ncbi:acyl-CoA dehydrogenase family protein [Phytoactinopolyspora halotolerans]|uniref:DNA alkylation response protein n=1 Tax=Phytoactinopolyspora halotolerans TaxID=1981512 RepID=A0A6L9SB86_9ACTN|nr:acyl-CoA dehydrogenase family protein [Phytoactinopolyspora halotolerans]NEE02369.1 DNA alkylation response protein [Phytoactinopolyspora halotolerans]
MRTTHQVTNQPPPLADYDVFAADAALVEAFNRHGDQDELVRMHALGTKAGSAEAQRWAREADAYPPALRTHDRFGHRIDEVDFHPSWHRLMETAVDHHLQSGGWGSSVPGSHATRATGFLIWSQVEAAHMCPISMTYAAVPALRMDPELAAVWEPRLTSTTYDFGLRPAGAKAGALAGMAMTEKQGGSDVRANTTAAAPATDGWYRLTGHKWFCSAPMNDVFLMLAQAPGGLTCFVVPRMLEDGTRNAIALQRLKDKLGNRANASAEIELDAAWGRRLGEEGRGVATIIEMVAATRLDCTLGSAALMRRAVAEACWHAAHRSAFGTKLDDAPLMQAVLADLAVESEAATALAIRLASSVDRADDPHERALRRIGLPLAKFWVCKRTPNVVAEALECLGGNGYVEESGMPRLYREAPLNSIWEGAGNIQALDLLRAISREPEALAAWRAEVDVADDAGPTNATLLRTALADTETLLHSAAADADTASRLARVLAARMAALLQASLLVRHAPPAVADAFCATRLDGAHGVFGLLPPAVEARVIVDRAAPAT